MTEKWKDVPGYKGMYQVSDQGRVKSLARIDARGNRRNERMLKSVRHHSGYRCVTLHKDSKPQWIHVHRLVALAFLGPSNGRQVNHKNGERADNRVRNLEWVTPAQNSKHKHEVLGVDFKGAKNPKAKLTAAQARQIKELHAKGSGYAELGRRFGVHYATIYDIVNRRSWRHV